MNETRKQRLIREAFGIDARNLDAVGTTMARVTLALALLVGASFASYQGTKDVPVVNGVTMPATQNSIAGVATLAAATSDAADRDD